MSPRGLAERLTDAFALVVDDHDAVFLFVNTNVVDPERAPGTGTLEPGGFTSYGLLDAVRRIRYELPAAGVDIPEVSPPCDHADITAALANRVVLGALSSIIRRRRRDERNHAAGDPARPLLSGIDPNE